MAGFPEPVHHHRPGQPVGAHQHDPVDRAARQLDRRLHRLPARPRACDASRPRPRRRTAWVEHVNEVAQRTRLPDLQLLVPGRQRPGQAARVHAAPRLPALRGRSARTWRTRATRALRSRRRHREPGRAAGGQRSVRVSRMSAYQAQFSPSASSSCQIARADVEPRRVDAEQHPRQVAAAPRSGCGNAHHDRRAAGAAVRARIGEEVALALEAQAERRGDHRVAHHRHVVQRVVKAERKAHHQQRGADLDLVDAGRAGAAA